MKASDILISKIKEFEGCKLYAYRCPSGIATIGFGHTKGVKMGMAITERKAEEYLREDLDNIVRELTKLNLPLDTQGKQDALIDWCFNFGTYRLLHGNDGKPTTLYKSIAFNADDEAIKAQFKRWVYSNGKPLKGLISRRAWEAKRWSEQD